MSLEGYTIGSPSNSSPTPTAPAAPSGATALKGFSIGQPIVANTAPNAMKGVQVNTPDPATPDISKIAADTKPVDTSGLFGNFLKQNNIAPQQNMNIGGETTPKVPVVPPQQPAMVFTVTGSNIKADTLTTQASTLNDTAATLTEQAKTLDKTDKNAVDSYNAQVDQFKKQTDEYNKNVSDYNVSQKFNYDIGGTQRIIDKMVADDPTQQGFLGTLKNSFIPTQFINSQDSSFTNDARTKVNAQYATDHPILSGIAQAVGAIANLVLIGKAGGGFELSKVVSSTETAQTLGNLFPTITRMIGLSAESGSIFGIQSALSTLIQQNSKKEFDPGQLAVETTKGVGTGITLGAAGSMATLPGRIAAGALTMGSLTAAEKLIQNGKLTSQDLMPIMVNTIIGAGFEATGASKTGEFRGQEMNSIANEQTLQTIMENHPDMTRADAQKISDLLGTLNYIVNSGYYQEAPANIKEEFKNMPSDFSAMSKEEKLSYFADISKEVTDGKTISDAINIANIKYGVSTNTIARHIVNSLGGNITTAPQSGTVLKKEISETIATHGEDVTHQALQEKLGVDATTASRLIADAKTPASIEDINKILDEASAKVAPPEEKTNLNSESNVVYRASEKPFDKALSGRAGTFVSPSEHIAGFFSENGKRSVEKLHIHPGAKELNWSDVPQTFKDQLKNGGDLEKIQGDIAEYARSKGFDVVNYEPNNTYSKGIERQIVNPEVLSNKPHEVSSKDLGHTYDEMPPEERAYAEREIASLKSKTPLDEAVNDMITGKLKLRAGGNDLKAEKRDILGGHQAFLFRKNTSLDTLDTVASNVGVSSDELLQHYMDRKINMQAGFINFGKAFEDVANLADKKLKDFVEKSLVPIKVAGNFSESIVKLEGEAQADLETINKIITKSKISAKDDEAVYHHAEDPKYKLTSTQEELAKQDKIFADLNRSLFERIKGAGTPLPDSDIYISRIVKEKPSVMQRMFDPIGKNTPTSKQGGILSKSAPSLKHRTMKVLIDENGNRTVASIKNEKFEVAGGKKTIRSHVVTSFQNKEATPLGSLKMKTKEDFLESEIKPIETKIKKVQKTIDALQKIQDIADPLVQFQVGQLGQEIDSLRESVPKNLRELNSTMESIQEKAKDFNKSEKSRAYREGYLSDLRSRMVKLVNEVAKIESKYNPEELNDKVFTANNGKIYTIAEATTKEIEQHTNIQYYHSALASRLLQYTKLRQIDRAIQFMESWKESDDFKLIAKPNSEIAPEGWRMTSNVYFRNYNFEPRTAEVMDDMQKKLDSGQFNNAFTGINRVLVDSIFFNGLAHPINVAVTWTYNRGVSGLFPQNLISGFKAGARALEALSTKNEDYLDLLRNGAHLMSSDVNNQKVAENMVKKLNAELQRKPDLHDKIMKALNILGDNANPINFKKNIIYKLSHDMAWLSNDFLTMQSIFEEMDRSGKSMPDAIKEVARFIPDYRQKSRLLDKPLSAIGQGNTARGLAKLVYNRNISMFGAYHVGLFQSFNNAVKDTITGDTLKDKVRGADRLAMLALLMLVVYPWLDKLFQKVTGNSNTYVTRSGVTKYPYLAYKALTGQTNGQAVATGIFPPAVGLQAGAELFFNRDFFTGNPIYGIGGEGLGSFATSKIAPAAEANKVASGKTTAEDFALTLIGVHTPANDQKSLDLNSMIYNEKPQVLKDAKTHLAAGDEAGAMKLVQDFNQRLLDQIKKTDNGGNTTPARVQYFFNQYGLKMPGKLAMDNFMAKQGKNIVQKVLPDGKPVVVKNTELPATGVIGMITTYAKAIGVDPISAFHDIFTGQSIKQVTNGTIIVNRMSLSQSQSDKADLAGGTIPKGMILDHIVPLEAGGTNDKSNLQLITTAQDGDAMNQPIEDFIGKELKSGDMTSAEAREISIRFKAGSGQTLTPELMKEYQDKYGSKPLTQAQVYDFKNSLKSDTSGPVSMIEKGFNSVFGAKTAEAAEFPPGYQPPTATTTDGVNVRQVPEQWQSNIDQAYQSHPALQKYPGLIQAILMQESSMGTADANYNPKIGESAWLGGLTNTMKAELVRNGIKVDANSQKGVINAIADYLTLKSKVTNPGSKVTTSYKDPVNLYLQRYKTASGVKLSPKAIARFRSYVNYYKDSQLAMK